MRFLKTGIIVCGLVFFLGLLATVFNTPDGHFKRACAEGQASINHLENQLNKLADNSEYLERIVARSLTTDEIGALSKESFHLYVYKGDSLLFWNNNQVLPEVSYDHLQDGGQLLKKKNGYYYGLSRTAGNYQLLALLLIKNDYTITNNYLKNTFSSNFPFDDEVIIVPADSTAAFTFTSQDETPVFGVLKKDGQTANLAASSLFTGIIALLAFWVLVWLIIVYFNVHYPPWASFVFLVFASVLFVEMIEFIDFEFKKGLVFSPQLYASQWYGQSLGHLFVHTLIVFFFNLLLAFLYAVRRWQLRLWQLTLIGVLSFAQLLAYHSVVKSMILDSIISFEINNFTLVTPYTFLGLVIISILTVSLFLSLYITLHSVRMLFGNKSWILFLVLALVSMTLLYYFGFNELAFIFPVIFLLHSLIYLALKKKGSPYRFAYVLNILLFAALTISSILRYYNQEHEVNLKESAANQLAESRDLISEYRFEEVQEAIKQDPFFKKFFVSPFVSQNELQQRLNYLYFGGYLSKYNVRSTAFNLEGKALKTNTESQLNDYYNLLQTADSTFSSNLFLLPHQEGKTRYLSILPIENEGKTSGTLVLELSPKTFTKENLYPELLVEQKSSPITQLRPAKDYDYGIYRQGLLINRAGEYPFPYTLNSLVNELPPPDHIHIDKVQLDFFLVNEETMVVIADEKDSLLTIISTFSYVFFFLSLLGLIAVVLIYTLNHPLHILPIRPFRLTFKNKINLAVALITVSSFIVIAIVSIAYFSNLSRENNTNKLIEKQQSILSSLEYTIGMFADESKAISSGNLSTEVASLAERQNIDINLFDLDGSLLLSSQPGVFGNGLVSKKIAPLAWHHLIVLQEERYIQEESIGLLKYQSIYVPVRLSSGEAIAILNLPYFAQRETLRKELSQLMIALLNVYVLLLIISIVIAFIISNSITRPLAKISNKMALIEFGRSNERIEWESSDEIGALVDQYNKMITQIEESALALAQSERESAWREMARQIAHEIKNPLTPMKLSIQHLQRAIKSDPDQVGELAERVTKTMVEQIDNLSEIATAFSSFAKMPKANKEEVNLKAIIESVIALFNENEGQDIALETALEEAIIFADKNQLISVFNNLVKNAQQATEDKVDARIIIRLTAQEDKYLVAIEDNGIGISADKMNTVFVPNFTTKSSGTGLGLAISKQIVENSEGEIWFESEENKGSTFFVTFPKLPKVS